MKRDLVTFKGVSEGVYLDVVGNDLEAIKDELNTKFNNASSFFKGAKFLGVRSDELSDDQIMEIKLTLKYKYEMNISNEGIPEYIEEYYTENVNENENENVTKTKPFDGIQEGVTKFIHGTLRSGQEVDYNGNIVIIGDVNPGAFIKAKGNIIVLGSLRGVAHAGIGGNYDSIVAAYNLLPMQLRIGDIIARSPDDEIEYKSPEIARIIEGEVFIEPYLPNK